MNDLELLVEANRLDTQNGTDNCKLSPHLVGADIKGKNGYVTMGVEPKNINEIIDGESLCLLVLINKKEYERLKGL